MNTYIYAVENLKVSGCGGRRSCDAVRGHVRFKFKRFLCFFSQAES